MVNNIRREVVCNVCGKTRMLSINEMEEDGWKFSTSDGLLCPKCVEIDRRGLPIAHCKIEGVVDNSDVRHLQLLHTMSHLHIIYKGADSDEN